MTHRTRTRLPSTAALARNATFGSKKLFSLDSTPRIHQGLALAAPARPSSNRARTDILIRILYPSGAPAGRLNGKSGALQQKFCDVTLESAESAAIISSHRWRVLITLRYIP